MRNKHVPLLFALLTLLFVTLLAGCSKQEPQPQAEVTPLATSAVGTPAPGMRESAVPPTIIVKTQLRPAIDPACLQKRNGFALVSAPLPKDGLEPGMVHVFCAVGAPADANVTFTLTGPDGQTQTFQAPSIDQGGVTVAVQPITIGPDAQPGKWTLTASYGDQSDRVTFEVKSATQPFVVLTEPVPDDPAIIKAAVGGLAPNAKVHFAVYRLQPGQVEGDVATAQGELLIENLIQVDEAGRADVQLDVADQPSGPYLLAIFSPDQPASATTVIQLPQQERSVVAVNISRGSRAQPETAEQPGAQPAPPQEAIALDRDALPPDPVLAEGSGGLPETITFSLKDASLPGCTPTSRPAIRLWPARGEVGQWWYGCASGFAANTPLRVDATLGDGTTTSFDLTATDAQGVKSLRWYALPSEGPGQFTMAISDPTGNQAQISWRIAPPAGPHVLVYPHVVIKDVGAELVLAGFKPRQQVQMGVYRIEGDLGTRVKTFKVKANKAGQLQQSFDLAQELTPGIYALVAQSAPTYQFAGIDTPATAVEFFSVGAPLPEKYEFFTLFLGRAGAQLVVSTEGDEEGQPPAQTPSGPSVSGIPTTLTLPVDDSPPPTCPNAPAGKPAICMIPNVIQRATYVYMLMHGFKPGTSFVIAVTTPSGKVVKFKARANQDGLADAHWYALNNEKLGTYRVRIRGGGKTFKGSFKVVKATSPHLVVQPRTPEPGTGMFISISGLQPNTTYVVARYRSTGEQNGQVQFELIDTIEMTTGKGGGAQETFRVGEDEAGTLFLAAVYEKGGGQPLAKEVYAPGQELFLRYPFAWAQNTQEGN